MCTFVVNNFRFSREKNREEISIILTQEREILDLLDKMFTLENGYSKRQNKDNYSLTAVSIPLLWLRKIFGD